MPAAMQTREPPRTFRVKSFGCQMNVYDGERMAEMLAQKGIAQADDDVDHLRAAFGLRAFGLCNAPRERDQRLRAVFAL